jgi:hypothetical protein
MLVESCVLVCQAQPQISGQHDNRPRLSRYGGLCSQQVVLGMCSTSVRGVSSCLPPPCGLSAAWCCWRMHV